MADSPEEREKDESAIDTDAVEMVQLRKKALQGKQSGFTHRPAAMSFAMYESLIHSKRERKK